MIFLKKLKKGFRNFQYAYIVEASQHGTAPRFENPLKYNSIQAFIAAILDLVVRLGAIVAVFMIIYSGFLYVKARGNPNEISKAHSTLLWTVVGTAVLIGAKIIAEVIEGTIKEIGGPGI